MRLVTRWTILILLSPFALALILVVSGVVFALSVWAGLSSYAAMSARRRSVRAVPRSRPGSST